MHDVTLPVAHRLHALGASIQLARPLGFNGTWRYLEAVVGSSWRDPAFLVPAAGLLQREWVQHREIEAAYARVRRDRKADGARTPPAHSSTPRSPRRWHGDESAGARFRLAAEAEAGRHRLDGTPYASVSAEVERIVSGELSVRDPAAMQHLLDAARSALGDAPAHRARVLLGQLYLIDHGAPPLHTAWSFTDPVALP